MATKMLNYGIEYWGTFCFLSNLIPVKYDVRLTHCINLFCHFKTPQ